MIMPANEIAQLGNRELSSDNQLMLDVKSGEIDKLGLLFEKYKNALYSYFYRIIRSKQASEDLVQDVFFRILKYKTGFTGYGKFTTWMYHIAHNVYADFYKKNKKMQITEDVSQLKMEDPYSADKGTFDNERQYLLSKAFHLIGTEQREILILSKYQGLKYKEIGEVLGCSEGAVKVRVFRALMDLKEIYLKLEE